MIGGLRMFTVYCAPRDHPWKYVVRGCTVDERGVVMDADPVFIGSELWAARDAIQHAMPGAVSIGRMAADEPQIVEVWI